MTGRPLATLRLTKNICVKSSGCAAKAVFYLDRPNFSEVQTVDYEMPSGGSHAASDSSYKLKLMVADSSEFK